MYVGISCHMEQIRSSWYIYNNSHLDVKQNALTLLCADASMTWLYDILIDKNTTDIEFEKYIMKQAIQRMSN